MGEGEKIRHEILNYLSENGRVRSNQIHPDIMKICKVSATPVYRELKKLVKSGQIKRDVITLAEVWYEAQDFEHNISRFIEFYESKLSKFDKLLLDWNDRAHNDSHIQYPEHQFRLLPLVKALQNISTHYNLISNAKIFKQSKKFKDLKKEIEKRYPEVVGSIHVLKYEKSFEDLLNTLHWEIENRYFSRYDDYIHPKFTSFSSKENIHEPK